MGTLCRHFFDILSLSPFFVVTLTAPVITFTAAICFSDTLATVYGSHSVSRFLLSILWQIFCVVIFKRHFYDIDTGRFILLSLLRQLFCTAILYDHFTADFLCRYTSSSRFRQPFDVALLCRHFNGSHSVYPCFVISLLTATIFRHTLSYLFRQPFCAALIRHHFNNGNSLSSCFLVTFSVSLYVVVTFTTGILYCHTLRSLYGSHSVSLCFVVTFKAIILCRRTLSSLFTAVAPCCHFYGNYFASPYFVVIFMSLYVVVTFLTAILCRFTLSSL